MEFIDIGALIPVVAILSCLGFGFIWLRYHELKLESRRLEQQAAASANENRDLLKRLAVLERIVTDRPSQLASEIEQLHQNERSA